MNEDKQETEMEEQEIPEDLKCVICMEIFLNPVILGCGHSFCKLCIQDILKTNPKCPTCKTPSFFGSENLRANFAVKSYIESKYAGLLAKRVEQEHAAAPVNDLGGGGNEALKNIACFSVPHNDGFPLFQGRSEWIPVSAHLNQELINMVCPGRLCMIGSGVETPEGVRINSLVEIQQGKFEINSSQLFIKSLGRFRIVNQKGINVTENPEVSKKIFGEEGVDFRLTVADVIEYRDDKSPLINPQEVAHDVDYIKTKMNHFMTDLRTHRHMTWSSLRNRFSLSFLDDHNLMLTPSTLSIFTLCAASLLHLNQEESVRAYTTTDPSQRLQIILNYLKPIPITAEPLVVFRNDTHSNSSMTMLIVIAAFIVFIIGGIAYRILTHR